MLIEDTDYMPQSVTRRPFKLIDRFEDIIIEEENEIRCMLAIDYFIINHKVAKIRPPHGTFHSYNLQ